MNRIIKIIYCCALILLLVLPTAGLIFDWEDDSSCEKRTLNSLPNFTWSKKFLEDFELFYNDHFSFRNRLNHWNSYLKYTLFKSSPKPQDAAIGKNNWLFYVGDNTLNSYARRNLLSEEKLTQKIQTWEKRKILLDSLGIEYHLAVFPNKSTIYGEHLPAQMKRQRRDTLSKIDQVLQGLSSSSDLQLIDVREELLSQKKQARIYHQHDTHWNSLGAFFAYQKLMQAMGIQPFQLEDFDINWEDDRKGDLLNILGLCNSQNITEEQPIFTPKNKNYTVKNIPVEGMHRMVNNFTTSEKTIVLFRDSYSSALVPFIALHFKEAYFLWSDYDQNKVNQINPDVVLEAKVERYF